MAGQAVRWGVPAAVFLSAMTVRGLGIRAASRDYVHWADDLQWVASAAASGAVEAYQPSLVLDDPLAALLRGPVFASASLEVFLSSVPVAWLGLAVHLRDLQLWTQTLLAGALLVALSGCVAWATILPDASGWAECEASLGAGGLKYYRQLVEESSRGEAIVDAISLQVRDMWALLPGHGLGARFRCGDGMFGYSACAGVLFARSLYDAVRNMIAQLAAPRWHAPARFTAACVLALVAAANMLLSISKRQGYTADVVVGCVAALLVYGSPAVAIVAERWAQGTPLVGPSAAEVGLEGASLAPGPPQEPLVYDEADLTMGPFCMIGDVYHIRSLPGGDLGMSPLARFVEEAAKKGENHRRAAAELAGRQREIEATIKAVDAEEMANAARKKEEFSNFLAREQEKLDAEAARAIVEAEERFAAERRAAAKREAVINEMHAARRASLEAVSTAAAADAAAEGKRPVRVVDDAEVEFTVAVSGGGPSALVAVGPETTVRDLFDLALTELRSRGEPFGPSSPREGDGGGDCSIEEYRGSYALFENGKRLDVDRTVAGLARTLTLANISHALDVSGSWVAANASGGYLVTITQDMATGEVGGKVHFPGQKDGAVTGKVKDGYCKISIGGARSTDEHGSYRVRTAKAGQLLWDVEGEWSATRAPPLAERGNATNLAGKWFWPLINTVFVLEQDKGAGKASGSIPVDPKKWSRTILRFDGYVNGNVLVLSIEPPPVEPPAVDDGASTSTRDTETTRRASALARISADGLTVEGDGLPVPGETRGVFTWWRAAENAVVNTKPPEDDDDEDEEDTD